MRKIYEEVEIVMSPQTEDIEFADDVQVAIDLFQSKGYEVEVQTQNISGHFAVLLLAYEKKADYTDY